MHRIAVGLSIIALLGGCMAAPQPSLRDPDKMISSAALFDPARFAGDWVVAQSATRGCAGAQQSWKLHGAGAYALSGIDCTGPVPAVLEGRAVLTGPGARLSPTQGFAKEPIFVLWVDQDYRVAALGTPAGNWGMVLTRPGMARGDLIAAAREVLDFNGYDLSRIGR
ncbi:apolipoprotein D and lipocalin family protein [Rhodobacter aestuarii]|uniref:Apolipoprotein D and lipocalin family protein n=1 Tax=Rhodobacter aestuarii TaxID=453582 RepID=A0A1N7MMT3_9RHOB|nr:hypothetical protein [Rhodobacter aestuarii]PTV96656.1 apolipoprotein D and lipocalin family protein [Rhodobacter aestuarii]SIS87350.1 apolipoprotein D and lipocalin family protein [Rhodobacter aestuarii]